MMKLIASLISLLLCSSLLSQIMILHDPVSARVFSSEKYSGIKGSPFLYDKWITGSVIVTKGQYNNLELKLDAYSSILYFNKDDNPWEFQDEVTGFIFMPDVSDSSSYLHFKKGVSGAGIKPDQFVQVLTEGKISLYKASSKLLTEVNEINAGLIKTFSNSTKYYITKDNVIQQINLTKKDIFGLIRDKEDKIQAYIDDKKLSVKKESDISSILKYYNTL